ncbi:MAG: hypothetical protein K8I27_16060 [Planctomycetes bacterium]|nr:hypothetical protein [Planctomycetota bacterium]
MKTATRKPVRFLNPIKQQSLVETGDNVYMKVPPSAYIPYASSYTPNGAPVCPRPAAIAPDDGMVPLAIVGMVLTVMLGIPVGLFTGPSALTRAKRVEHFISTGKRPPTDSTNVTTTRVCAWIGIAWSIPLILIWAFVLGMLVLVAG